MTVQDVMTRGVVVGEQADFRDVVGLLGEHHVSALPVVDGSGRVTGVVSESDLYLNRVQPRRHGLAALLPHPWRHLDQRKAIGIVTRGDLLKAYQRLDEDIRTEILRRAVPGIIERAVETVQVQVHGGVVELDGRVTRRTQALALAARARAIDGVIAVHSHLAYEVKDTSDWAKRDPAA